MTKENEKITKDHMRNIQIISKYKQNEIIIKEENEHLKKKLTDKKRENEDLSKLIVENKKELKLLSVQLADCSVDNQNLSTHLNDKTKD